MSAPRAVLPFVLAAAFFAGCSGEETKPPLKHPVSVFPADGTKMASPKTQVTIRDATPRELDGGVEVKGSKSGDHDGRLRSHSDGRGASFVPDKPLADHERVTVRVRGKVVSRFTVTAPAEVALPAQQTGRKRIGVARFRSRPDLQPSALKVNVASTEATEGHIFLAPKGPGSQGGPTILDPDGRLVWFRPMPGALQAYNFRVQRYQGKPVLTWFQGEQATGVGRGEGLIYDTAYRPVARVRTGNGYDQDLHEFVLTDRGTALIDAYNPVTADLSGVGGPRDGLVWDCVVQEVDVKTGVVLFEWHSLDHVPITDSYRRAPKDKLYDYFHANSIDELPDGNLLVSSRDTHTVYAIDRKNGRIVWRLGGKHSTFAIGPGADFHWQHDAEWHGKDELSVFNNNSLAGDRNPAETSGLVIRVDKGAKRATLVRSYTHPEGLESPSKGNMQLLPDGHAFLGWGGKNPRFSEFGSDGELLFDESLLSPKSSTYRAYRQTWKGQPTDSPAAAATTAAGATTVYASWNGATEVARWRVRSGTSADSLKTGATVARTDFETAIPLGGAAKLVQVEALDRSGQVIGRSRVVAAKPGP
ncbi:MAG TPA: arylsulfotransferase family protein [Thermoleophilaceae bacterium]|nr:arylsulfotransferase family protein [Thermoleophilaceae bacterium]